MDTNFLKSFSILDVTLKRPSLPNRENVSLANWESHLNLFNEGA